MLEHNIHLGFSSGPVDSSLFDSFTWHRGGVYLVTGKQHRLAGRSAIKLKELQDEMVIAFNDDTYPQNILTRLCVQNGIIPAFYLEGFEIGLFQELCSNNKIAAFWEGPMDYFPELIRIEIEDINLEWEAHFIVQKNVYLNDAEKQFIEYVTSNLPIR
jgi:hypothetical protein